MFGENTSGRSKATPGEVLIGLAIFLSFNFLVAAIYFHIINP